MAFGDKEAIDCPQCGQRVFATRVSPRHRPGGWLFVEHAAPCGLPCYLGLEKLPPLIEQRTASGLLTGTHVCAFLIHHSQLFGHAQQCCNGGHGIAELQERLADREELLGRLRKLLDVVNFEIGK